MVIRIALRPHRRPGTSSHLLGHLPDRYFQFKELDDGQPLNTAQPSLVDPATGNSRKVYYNGNNGISHPRVCTVFCIAAGTNPCPFLRHFLDRYLLALFLLDLIHSRYLKSIWHLYHRCQDGDQLPFFKLLVILLSMFYPPSFRSSLRLKVLCLLNFLLRLSLWLLNLRLSLWLLNLRLFCGLRLSLLLNLRSLLILLLPLLSQFLPLLFGRG